MKASNKNTQHLYDDLAWIWPIISLPIDHEEETELFTRVIKENSLIEAKTLLHLGCSSGYSDYTFKKHFKVTGVDISNDMLKLARKLNPEVVYRYGDMRTVQLEGQFDAVVILDSITYMSTIDDLKCAFSTAYYHLREGGTFLTVVEEAPEKFKQNNTFFSIHSKNDTEIVFIENCYDPDTSDTTYESTFIILVRHKGKLEIHTDRHVCGIFPLKTWTNLLTGTGFKVKQIKPERLIFPRHDYYALFACKKPLMEVK